MIEGRLVVGAVLHHQLEVGDGLVVLAQRRKIHAQVVVGGLRLRVELDHAQEGLDGFLLAPQVVVCDSDPVVSRCVVRAQLQTPLHRRDGLVYLTATIVCQGQVVVRLGEIWLERDRFFKVLGCQRDVAQTVRTWASRSPIL